MTTDDISAWWAFYDIAMVKELGQQLAEGLIHPLEYANAIIALADIAGLKFNS